VEADPTTTIALASTAIINNFFMAAPVKQRASEFHRD